MMTDVAPVATIGQHIVYQSGRMVLLWNLPVKVNADGSNGQTRVSLDRARQLWIFVPPGASDIALATYHPLDWGDRGKWIPEGRAPYGLDAPENGGKRIFAGDDEVLYRAWGFLLDKHGEPVIQGLHDPAPGYYVSTTALRYESLPLTDPKSYFDSASLPGATLPGEDLLPYGVSLGDLALVKHGPYKVFVRFFDVGKSGDLLELSPAACDALGIPDRARDVGAEDGTSITIFPGSSGLLAHPLASADEIQTAGKRAAALHGLPGY
jgi:hypothetical protein